MVHILMCQENEEGNNMEKGRQGIPPKGEMTSEDQDGDSWAWASSRTASKTVT